MHSKIKQLTLAAVCAALYAALTWISALPGLAFGTVQFRISEALTVLPIFSAAAIPGLTVGCLVSNIVSTVSPFDAVFGTAATLLAAVLTRVLRNIKIKNYPFLSMLMPVVVNALFVGAEIAFFTSPQTFLTAFILNFLSVFAGQAAVLFTLGSALYFFIDRHSSVKSLITQQNY